MKRSGDASMGCCSGFARCGVIILSSECSVVVSTVDASYRVPSCSITKVVVLDMVWWPWSSDSCSVYVTWVAENKVV
jgi:hypothetical protein